MRRLSAMHRAIILLMLTLAPTIATALPFQEGSYENLGRAVIEKLRTRSRWGFKGLTAPIPASWRAGRPMDPNDSGLARRAEERFYAKLQSDFDAILESARSRNIDLSKLEFVAVLPDTSSAAMFGFKIRYGYQGLTGTIAASAAYYEGRYCLHELLESADLFARLSREDSYEDLGRAVIEAFRVGSYSGLQALTPPTPAVWRKLSPKELGKSSDREIARKLRRIYYPKLRRDFNGIIESARSRNVDLAQLEFIEARPDMLSRQGSLIGVAIVYAYKGRTGTIAISALALAGSFYLHEILRSHDVFAQVIGE